MTTVHDRPIAPAAPGSAAPAEPSVRERARIVLVLGSLIALGPLTIDMYLPALPAIETALNTSPAAIQLTLTGTLAGVAVGQLVIGPLSDALGRRRPLIAGTVLHVLASVLCVVAPNVALLGVLRVLQGLGAAAAGVIAMAVVRDLFSGLTVARVLSRLMLVMGVAPVLAPTLGSQLLRWTNWRGVFVALAVLGAGLVAVSRFALRETLPPERRRSGGLTGTVRTYAGLLGDRVYLGLVLVTGLAMAALFAYVSGSSFVLQQQYGLDEQQFGIAFGAGSVSLIAATQLNVRLLRRFTPQRILTGALVGGTVAGAVLLLFAAAGVGGLAGVLVPLWVVLGATGLVFPNAPAIALARHGEAAGTASALLGAVQFGVGALAAPLVGVLGNGSAAMAAVVAAGMLLSATVLVTVVRPGRLPASEAALPQEV
ncbi:multidrug effflux MFS transporter [Rhizomonospora bruguierae]|uniref:multidrug effflux MFS transporter n=1 Tax=Rhizomonospora bruguierae TaxID=1581705 RepID=UPI001BCC8626|nr:multidrug effflux MFS transporter [Micromonospora sp. NBRC 107566]